MAARDREGRQPPHVVEEFARIFSWMVLLFCLLVSVIPLLFTPVGVPTLLAFFVVDRILLHRTGSAPLVAGPLPYAFLLAGVASFGGTGDATALAGFATCAGLLLARAHWRRAHHLLAFVAVALVPFVWWVVPESGHRHWLAPSYEIVGITIALAIAAWLYWVGAAVRRRDGDSRPVLGVSPDVAGSDAQR